MQSLVSKIVLILTVVIACVLLAYPPEQKIRLGKDLRGGTSLIYHVAIPDDVPNAERQAILTQTIEVLKERVNPQGVLDISMAPLGSDRIEVIMPLPNDQMKALRQQYEEALDQLVQNALVRPGDLDDALQNQTAVLKFGGDPAAPRFATLTELQLAFDTLGTTREAHRKAVAASAPAEEISTHEQALADAQFNFEQKRDAVLRTSLDETRVVRTLNLPKAAPKDSTTGSAREVALTALKQEFPHLAEPLDRTVAAYDSYQSQRTTLDDPEDLMRLLRGAGVLEFRIAVRPGTAQGVSVDEMRKQLVEVGPEKTDSSVARWYPINDLKQWYKEPAQLLSLQADPVGYFSGRGLAAAEHEGKYYLLLYTTREKSMTHTGDVQWTVSSTGRTQDELGRPAVSFGLDTAGGSLMSRLTGPHVGEPMAIVLDGQVYTAPSLNSAIGNSGIIQGEFSPSELEYLTRVLAAGALSARLSDQPIAINTLGPSLGKDNLVRGLEACLLSLIVTAVIMFGYYFLAGAVANIALLINTLVIFGVMALIDGTFTLPGLAGIALSIAMAVDANVLIYERIREEIVNNKEDLRTAIRLGFNRAMSAIIDGNLTNLIVCVVLMYTATTEVKGFALTMVIGVAATLFCALFVTRVLYTLYADVLKFRTLPMLPTVFPGVHRALTPSVNWINKRYAFWTVSLIASIASIGLVWSRGGEMLDMEFKGGISMTMQTRLANTGEEADPDGRLVMTRPDVEQRIRNLGSQPGIAAESAVYQLRTASVLTLGTPLPDFKASSFRIKVSNPPGVENEQTVTDEVVDAIVKEFGDRLDVMPSLTFTGRGDTDHNKYTHSISSAALGANIGQSALQQNVSDYIGGVAVIVDNISPAVTIENAQLRIERLRNQPDFSKARGRDMKVFGVTAADSGNPAAGYTSIAVVSYDPNIDQQKVDFELWDRELAASEWQLVSTALERRSSLQEISSFSPAMASTLAASAVVAVFVSMLGMLVYIWVRFGSLRFSVATIIGLIHNVIVCLGALALTHYLAGTGIAAALMLDEFRIDLNVIAALLTIIGYSLNDTIVILDRIRENRGRRPELTADIVNKSINQTFSRTILTGGSTILASIILFVLGGPGIQPFAFTFLIGLVVGTYSSVAISAPLVIHGPKRSEPQPVALETVGLTTRPSGTAAATVG